MDYACLYNPEFGDEEHVEKQLVFRYGEPDDDSAIKRIGIAQGLVELAHSFDGNPVSWIRTGTQVILVQQLEREASASNADWRSGYWFTCGVSGPATTANPEELQNIIRDAYQQWRLHNTTIAEAIDNIGTKGALDRWWTAFCTNWTGIYELGALGAVPYVRMAPGTLSPAAAELIEQTKTENSMIDLLVTKSDDSSYIWSGTNLAYETKLAIQNWLAECDLCENVAYTEQSGYVFHLRRPDTGVSRVDTESKQRATSNGLAEPAANVPEPPATEESNGYEADLSQLTEEMSEYNFDTSLPPEIDADESVDEIAGQSVSLPSSNQGSVLNVADSTYNDSLQSLPQHNLPDETMDNAAETTEPGVEGREDTPSKYFKALSGFSSYMPQMGSFNMSSMGHITPTMPSISSFSTMSLPTMPTMPSMLSMPALPNMPTMPTMPAMPSMQSITGWMPKGFYSDSADGIPVTVPQHNETIEFLGTGKYLTLPQGKAWVLIYRRPPFAYTMLFDKSEFDEPVQESKQIKRSLDTLARQLEGFSFAFFSPTPFIYLVVDNKKRIVCSTLQRAGAGSAMDSMKAQATISDLIRRNDPQSRSVMRTTGNWWVYKTNIMPEVEVIFVTKWLRKDAKDLLGALHRDTKEWLDNYRRTYSN